MGLVFAGKICQCRFRRLFPFRIFGRPGRVPGCPEPCQSGRIVYRKRSLGAGHNAEVLAVILAPPHGLGHGVDVVGNLGDEDHVGPAGQPGAQAQPAGIVAHDFHHDDAVVAVGCGMQPVDGAGGHGQRGIEAKGDVGGCHVVVDGLGQGNDVHAQPGEAEGVFLGAATTDADQGLQIVAVVVVEHHPGHVLQLPAHGHLVGFVAACAQDGAALGENAGENVALQGNGAVLHETSEAVAKADDVHAAACAVFADGPNGGVETRAVATSCQNSNTGCHIASLSAGAVCGAGPVPALQESKVSGFWWNIKYNYAAMRSTSTRACRAVFRQGRNRSHRQKRGSSRSTDQTRFVEQGNCP